MNANPYLHLCCLTALLNPSSANLRAVPIQTARAVDPVSGARVAVELSVVRSGGALTFEAVVSYKEKDGAPLTCRVEHALTFAEINSYRFGAFNPVAVLFTKIEMEAWRFVLDPTINKFRYAEHLIDWLRRFKNQLKQCERELRKDEQKPALSSSTAVVPFGYQTGRSGRWRC